MPPASDAVRRAPPPELTPAPAAGAAIEFAPGVAPFEPRPLVADILRTRYCVQGSVFLVERVECVPVGRRGKDEAESGSRPPRRWRAIRLLVGDGEHCVQALLRGEVHGFVDSGRVEVGCYVRLDRFELQVVDVGGTHAGAGGGDAGDGLGDGEDELRRAQDTSDIMVFLVVDDLVTVGWNHAYLKMWRAHGGSPGMEIVEPESDFDDAQSDDGERDGIGTTDERAVIDGMEAISGAMAENIMLKGQDLLDPEDLEDDGFEAMDVSEERATQRRRNAEMLNSVSRSEAYADRQQLHGISGVNPEQATAQSSEHTTAAPSRTRPPSNRLPNRHNTQVLTVEETQNLPWSTTDPRRPVKLTALRSIPNLPFKQNWVVNVLAVVSHLSDLEPSTLPPGRQRTARLADASTPKHVLLTVFLDPEDFAPAVGTVVLLLGVKNHRFDGGSLKKYASDRPRTAGAAWWFPEPAELGWCDVEGLRRWWEETNLSGDDEV